MPIGKGKAMKQFIKLMIFTLAIFASTTASAGREAGGGHAVIVHEDYYLFDFFEHGIENDVYIRPDCRVDQTLQNKVRGILSFDWEIADKVTCKLLEVKTISPKVYGKLTEVLFNYQWSVILPELFHQYDIGKTPIKNVSGLDLPLVQAALRFDDRNLVYMDRTVCEKLPKDHLVGLVFHEIVF